MKYFFIVIFLFFFTISSYSSNIRINIGSEPGTLDWNLATDSSSFQIINNIMAGLTKFNDKLELEANLAESWEIIPKEKKIIIKIKDNIKWSDDVELICIMRKKNVTDWQIEQIDFVI